jgi:hypothetical protein
VHHHHVHHHHGAHHHAGHHHSSAAHALSGGWVVVAVAVLCVRVRVLIDCVGRYCGRALSLARDHNRVSVCVKHWGHGGRGALGS